MSNSHEAKLNGSPTGFIASISTRYIEYLALIRFLTITFGQNAFEILSPKEEDECRVRLPRLLERKEWEKIARLREESNSHPEARGKSSGIFSPTSEPKSTKGRMRAKDDVEKQISSTQNNSARETRKNALVGAAALSYSPLGLFQTSAPIFQEIKHKSESSPMHNRIREGSDSRSTRPMHGPPNASAKPLLSTETDQATIITHKRRSKQSQGDSIAWRVVRARTGDFIRLPINSGHLGIGPRIGSGIFSDIFNLEVFYLEGDESIDRVMPWFTLPISKGRRETIAVKKLHDGSFSGRLFRAEVLAFDALLKSDPKASNVIQRLLDSRDLNDKSSGSPIFGNALLFPRAMFDLEFFLSSPEFLGTDPGYYKDAMWSQISGLAQGLLSVHHAGIAHCDLNPRNVLVFKNTDGTIVLKICDFGHSVIVGEELYPEHQPNMDWKPFKSNGAYSAMECWSTSDTLLKPIDIWALGCILMELVAFVIDSKTGVADLKKARTGSMHMNGMVLPTDTYHDGTRLKVAVRNWLSKIAQAKGYGSICRILEHMLEPHSKDRPSSQVVVRNMAILPAHPELYLPPQIYSGWWPDLTWTNWWLKEDHPNPSVSEKYTAALEGPSIFLKWCIFGASMVEKPLAPSAKRVRWTCVCNRKFYDDFEELVPGAVETEVQSQMDAVYEHKSINHATQLHGVPTTVTAASSGAASSVKINQDSTSSNQTDSWRESSLQNILISEDDSGDMSTLTHRARELGSKSPETTKKRQYWILPCFESTEFGLKAIHEEVTDGGYDFDLFTKFRKLYFGEKSWLRRFFELREVRTIDFIRFNLLALDKVDILEKDKWPPEEDRHLWVYVPCPPKTVPLVSKKLLMHLWRNPHHSDELVYQAWKKKTSAFGKFLEQLRLWPLILEYSKSPGDTLTSPQRSLPASEFQELPKSAYVYVKVPKKVGDKLEPNYGDQAPEGWGMCFEEKFTVHRLLFVILLFYFFVSVVILTWIIDKYGVVSPSNWMGLFGLLSWVTSFLGLLLTVWFKWAESG